MPCAHTTRWKGVPAVENNPQSRSASEQDASANKKKQSAKAPESEGYDKKLDGPNRPSI